ncbi:NAD(P)/FAD-dependent oxidoreductase [Microbacterium paludicola]|uniref:FAD-dependent oxidoreductase n=1 Tax=Microbacterium paludicola TaxID=300019 RepID=UPI0011A6C154|nr:NAD(P)/FAD-dependent oxidoreductase [Microbacterium paludicola]
MPDHEVVIVGAGPVGLLLGCLLAERGIDVAVYESREGADHRSRAIGIHPPGLAALQAAGVGAQVRAESLALDRGEVICDGRVLASIAFSGEHRVLILPQHRTHALLRERLTSLRSDALRLGHTVGVVRNTQSGVSMSIGHREVSAAVVVAADGVRSGIRRQLGIHWRRGPGRGRYAMADVPDHAADRTARLYCERDGLVESFPLPDGMRRWVVSDPDGVLAESEAFGRAIRDRAGLRVELPSGTHPTPFIARQHRAARLAAGRVVLVGDAAHETSPIGGQGMNLGWAAAPHLAAAVARTLDGRAPDFHDYERTALRAAARAQRRSMFYMTMGRSVRGPALAVRNAGIRMLGSPALRRRSAAMITMQGR